jgi:periplasmic protein TonB
MISGPPGCGDGDSRNPADFLAQLSQRAQRVWFRSHDFFSHPILSAGRLKLDATSTVSSERNRWCLVSRLSSCTGVGIAGIESMSEITEQGLVRLPELDQPWRRLPAIVGVSLVIWCGVLAVFGLFLELSRVTPPYPEPIEAQLVDLPISGLAGGGGGSPGAAHVSPAPKVAKAIPINKTRPKTPHVARPHPVRTVTDDALSSHELMKTQPVAPPATYDISKSTSKPEADANPPIAQPSGTVGSREGGVGNGTGTGAGNGVGAGSGTGAGGGFGSGGNGPEPIYAPAPTIPDDMRDEVLEAVAIARFQVSSKGTFVVSLTKPTDFSRLNNIILETLRTWRFHPASRNGVAIDSDAQIRLLITVQ